MIVALIALAAIFFIARAVLVRSGAHGRFAVPVALALVASLACGAFAARFVFADAGSVTDVVPEVPAFVAPAPIASGRPPVRSSVAALGAVDDLKVRPGGKALSVRGWLANPTEFTPVKRLYAIVDGTREYDVSAHYFGDRPDVAKALAHDSALATGFSNVLVPLDGLSPGLHRLEMGGATSDGHSMFVLPTAAEFTL